MTIHPAIGKVQVVCSFEYEARVWLERYLLRCLNLFSLCKFTRLFSYGVLNRAFVEEEEGNK